jgi:hypothetical protein
LLDAAIQVQEFLRSQGWEFCLIGGLAVVRWGEPRATRDVDLTLLTGFGNEEQYLRLLLRRFKARIDDPVPFVLQNRVALLTAANGVPIDISFGAIPFEIDVIRRATPFEFERGYELITASAEDLIVMKSLAGRPQDWTDVEGMIVRQSEVLDWELIDMALESLAEYFPECDGPVRLRELRHDVERQFAIRQKPRAGRKKASRPKGQRKKS